MRAPNRAIRASRRTGRGVSGSCSTPVSAPCRASVRPHFNRRHKWVTEVVTCLCSCGGRSPDSFLFGLDPGLRRGTTNWRSSYFPARVDGYEATQHRLGGGADEPRLADHRPERVRAREATNAFNEVAIAFLIVGDDLADPRDHLVGPAVIELGETRPVARRKFHAKEPPAALQDAMGFGKRYRNVGDVSD